MSDSKRTLDELAAHCIRCGFCLESCPTFVLTGEETESPRGRIYLARSAEAGKLDWEAARPHLEHCLGCRACETACPSGVEYGAILEMARSRLEASKPNTKTKLLLKGITDPGTMRLQLAASRLVPGKKLPTLLSKLLSGEAPEAEKPRTQAPSGWAPLDESEMPAIRGEVFLLEGCAMRVLFPRVHEATRRLLRRLGYVVRTSNAGCCGALHAHAGLIDEGAAMAHSVAAAMPGELPVIVNSAGCGSHLKDVAAHGVPELAGRVMDISEFFLREGLADLLPRSNGLAGVAATYHDACHLAHGQKVTQPPRALLDAVPGLDIRPLAESDMCCGSAGIYNVVQPRTARKLLNRKWANVEATGATLCVLGNPGCHAWMAQAAREKGAKVRVLHLAEALEAAFSGLPRAD